MKKYLAFYENEWPANIAELTAVENKPFVGYLKGQGVQFTVIPKPLVQRNCEVWYTTSNGEINPFNDVYCDANLVSNTYENGLGIAVFDKDITHIWSWYVVRGDMSGGLESFIGGIALPNEHGEVFEQTSYLTEISLPGSLELIDEFALCYSFATLNMSPVSTLQVLTLGKNIKTIKGNLFNLEKVQYKGTADSWSKIEFIDNYLDMSKISEDALKDWSGTSGNADPSKGAELIFI